MLRSFYDMELYIQQILHTYAKAGGTPILDEERLAHFIKDMESKLGIALSVEQKDAVALANHNHQIFGICGYAGSGKSSVSKVVLNLLMHIYPMEFMVCCSLSGVAANRIKQLTGFNAFTIHALLKFKGAHFEHNKDNKLPHKVILLDEASMVNVPIFHALLEAINFEQGAVLILVGDIAQLPPIGAGDVYADIIKHDLARACQLQKIYRQDNQVIKLFASHIRQGQVPNDYLKPYEDFAFVANQNGADAILHQITQVAHEFTDMRFLYTKDTILRYITYFQVISPIKNHTLGVNHLNKTLQNILNPTKGKSLTIKHYEFRVRDKVIHLKNKNMPTFTPDEFKQIDIEALDPKKPLIEKRIFNGQIGVITHIEITKQWVFVFYPIDGCVVWYKADDLKDDILDLSYAMSGHKTQGSEFENVIIPITFAHYKMLHNRLMYTMVTRVKKKLILIGETGAFEAACKRIEASNRLTLMGHSIR